eukprot:GFYU01009490.1.p1 GENE.GFYU01009490.1~~GFYU01009490.1.p1  ORF type:complete len:493 (+),score=36.88 GFYU01009490.1:76-1479(+)
MATTPQKTTQAQAGKRSPHAAASESTKKKHKKNRSKDRTTDGSPVQSEDEDSRLVSLRTELTELRAEIATLRNLVAPTGLSATPQPAHNESGTHGRLQVEERPTPTSGTRIDSSEDSCQRKEYLKARDALQQKGLAQTWLGPRGTGLEVKPLDFPEVTGKFEPHARVETVVLWLQTFCRPYRMGLYYVARLPLSLFSQAVDVSTYVAWIEDPSLRSDSITWEVMTDRLLQLWHTTSTIRDVCRITYERYNVDFTSSAQTPRRVVDWVRYLLTHQSVDKVVPSHHLLVNCLLGKLPTAVTLRLKNQALLANRDVSDTYSDVARLTTALECLCSEMPNASKLPNMMERPATISLPVINAGAASVPQQPPDSSVTTQYTDLDYTQAIQGKQDCPLPNHQYHRAMDCRLLLRAGWKAGNPLPTAASLQAARTLLAQPGVPAQAGTASACPQDSGAYTGATVETVPDPLIAA